MRYERIDLDNHRVFRGHQTLTLPDDPGVIVIYGRNGKGKTTFLNAIRWAWTGVCKGRGGRVISGARLVNSLALQEALPGESVEGSVTLVVNSDGHVWEIRRSVTVTDGDTREDLLVLRDRIALSSADAHAAVAELMPPEVEGFFLFDGELLDSYEKLVDEEPLSGSPLRDAIEQVLGIPLIANAAKDARFVEEKAGKALAEAAKRDRATKQLGIALEQAQDIAAKFRSSRDQEDELISDLTLKLRAAEEELAAQSNTVGLLARRDDKRQRVRALNDRHKEQRRTVEALLVDGWKALVADPVRVVADQLEKELDADREQLQTLAVSASLRARQRLFGDGCCPACGCSLNEAGHAHVAELMHENAEVDLDQIAERVQHGSARLRSLRSLADPAGKIELLGAEASMLRIQNELEAEQDSLKELEEQLEDAPTTTLEELVKQRTSLSLKLEQARADFTRAADGFKEKNQAIEALRREIDAKGSSAGQDPLNDRRQKLARSLAELFETAQVTYREALKQRVQESATEIFTAMRSETDFAKLVINEQFGLRILDTTGRVVEDRSAGYEHLVALSLIGALQRSSPIRGPIVMDTPFGRLDPDHVEAVLGQLETIAEQVFVVVHTGELPIETARRQLRGRLLMEREIARAGSSQHSELRELTP